MYTLLFFKKIITIGEVNQKKGISRKNTDSTTKNCKVETKKVPIVHVMPPTKPVVVPLKNANPDDECNVKNQIKMYPTSPKKPEVYKQRKSMLLEYKDLFAALMKLPDRELQKNLLDVINNHRVMKYRTIGTQTDHVEFKEPIVHQDKTASPPYYESSVSNFKSCKVINILKKRKRKVSLPQANKESRARQLPKINKPRITNGNCKSITAKKDEFKCNPSKRQRNNSSCVSECSSEFVNIFEDTEAIHSMQIEQCFLLLESGLLPIQDAVVRNQVNNLNFHISKWRAYRGTDINDILTEDDEDLLQLAILNTCDTSIVTLLLENGLNPNSLDADSNTVVHMAIINDITVASLNQLMKHIDLKLILTLNDDGYTPLHLAVRQDRYLLAESLINVLDERLANKVFYKRPFDTLDINNSVLKKKFKDYYEKICQYMLVDKETNFYSFSNHELKQRLLQIGDRKSGNTSLYFAITEGFEHLTYFLLAHLTDPRVQNLSGIDCQTYVSEFGKSLNFSVKIDATMDKVIKILSQL